MPGELANVIAGRTAQLFDLGGANSRRRRLRLPRRPRGGLREPAHRPRRRGDHRRRRPLMSPAAFVKFSKIGALSPDGSRPFDAGANGFVMGEGAGDRAQAARRCRARRGHHLRHHRGHRRLLRWPRQGDHRAQPGRPGAALARAYEDAGFGPARRSRSSRPTGPPRPWATPSRSRPAPRPRRGRPAPATDASAWARSSR